MRHATVALGLTVAGAACRWVYNPLGREFIGEVPGWKGRAALVLAGVATLSVPIYMFAENRTERFDSSWVLVREGLKTAPEREAALASRREQIMELRKKARKEEEERGRYGVGWR